MAKESRTNAFDPRPYIGHFARDYFMTFVFIPLTLNFPVTMLLLDHSGMGLEIGED